MWYNQNDQEYEEGQRAAGRLWMLREGMVINMSDPVFDLDSWEPLFKINEKMAVDPKGMLFTKMNENMLMDLDTGRVRFITPWSQGEEKGDS